MIGKRFLTILMVVLMLCGVPTVNITADDGQPDDNSNTPEATVETTAPAEGQQNPEGEEGTVVLTPGENDEEGQTDPQTVVPGDTPGQGQGADASDDEGQATDPQAGGNTNPTEGDVTLDPQDGNGDEAGSDPESLNPEEKTPLEPAAGTESLTPQSTVESVTEEEITLQSSEGEEGQEEESYFYELIFDSNGGSHIDEEGALSDSPDGWTFYVPQEIPEREGYKFLGWARTRRGDVEFQPTDPITVTADDDYSVTLYAKWQELYKYTLVLNTGSGDPLPDVVEYDESSSAHCFNIENIKPIRDGYYFLGWGTSKRGSTVDVDPSSVKVDRTWFIVYISTKEIYAKWKKIEAPIDYSLDLDANGGLFEDDTDTKHKEILDSYADNATFTLDIPEKEGYAFLGWTTDPESEDIAYSESEDTITLRASEGETEVSLKLYAAWQKIYDYRLIYDINDGSGHCSEETASDVPSDSCLFIISDYAPQRNNYRFDGWMDSEGNIYQAGDDFYIYAQSEEQDVVEETLTAQWTRVFKYTLKFDLNGGEGGPEKLIEADSTLLSHTFTIPEVVPTKEHHRFLGWRDPLKPVKLYQPGEEISIVTPDRDRTLHAVWKLQTKYTLTYFDNVEEEEIEVPEVQIEEGDLLSYSFTVSDFVPEREGFAFLGWSESEYATEAKYLPGDETDPISFLSGKKDLYAVWQKVYAFTLKFDANGGKNPPADLVENDPDPNMHTFTIPSEKPTIRNRQFVGWSMDKDAEEPEFFVGDSITAYDRETTLYAVYEKGDYVFTLKFDANGGSDAPETDYYVSSNILEALIGHNFTVPEKEPVREGFEFLGWAYSEDSLYPADELLGGIRVWPGETTVYAVWGKPTSYAVYFVDLLGEGKPDTMYYPGPTGSETTTDLVHIFTVPETVPVKEGYEFENWIGSDLQTYEPGDKLFMTAIKLDPETIAKILAERMAGESIDLADLVEIIGNIDRTEVNEKVSTTLVANWKKVFTANYGVDDEKHGTVSVASEKHYIGGNFEGSEAIANQGYYFSHWSTKILGVDVEVSDSAKFVPESQLSRNYTAHFEPAKNTPYKVEYYFMLDDGTYPEQTDRFVIRTGKTDLKVKTFSYDHECEDEGYIYDADCELNYETGRIAADGSLVLKVYFSKAFTVTYNDGADGTVFAQETTGNLCYGDLTPELDAPLDRPNYNFAGWLKASDGTVVDEVDETVTGNETYTAVWEGKTLYVTYKLNGGNYDGKTEDVVEEYKYYEGASFIVKEGPTMEGKEFAGWDLKGYVPGEEMPLVCDIELTATWKDEEPENPVVNVISASITVIRKEIVKSFSINITSSKTSNASTVAASVVSSVTVLPFISKVKTLSILSSRKK